MINTNVYAKDLFKNPNIPYLFNSEITEYDMKDAGYSIIQEFHLLPDDLIEKLGKMKKDKRTIEIGKISKNHEFSKKLMDGFKEARRLFFDANNLEIFDIVSIKKDAIFLNKICKDTQVGKFILFRQKNTYTSYIQLGSRIELYYNPYELEVKGISDDVCEKHKDYMLSFINTFFNLMETTKPEVVLTYLNKFISEYKRKELLVGYYRRFDTESLFIESTTGYLFGDYLEADKDQLDISYNLFNVLLKLVTIPINVK